MSIEILTVAAGIVLGALLALPQIVRDLRDERARRWSR